MGEIAAVLRDPVLVWQRHILPKRRKLLNISFPKTRHVTCLASQHPSGLGSCNRALVPPKRRFGGEREEAAAAAAGVCASEGE